MAIFWEINLLAYVYHMGFLNIRPATIEHDYDSVWNIFSEVIRSGDTYVFDPKTPKSDLKKLWFGENIRTFVAEEDAQVSGTYIIRPNYLGLGSHIANCGYMVHPAAQGKGIGKQLCEHSIFFAKECGYHAIQFNVVVSTNDGAVALWKKFGFSIIGTTPNGFNHSTLGFVDTYIMYKKL